MLEHLSTPAFILSCLYCISFQELDTARWRNKLFPTSARLLDLIVTKCHRGRGRDAVNSAHIQACPIKREESHDSHQSHAWLLIFTLCLYLYLRGSLSLPHPSVPSLVSVETSCMTANSAFQVTKHFPAHRNLGSHTTL